MNLDAIRFDLCEDESPKARTRLEFRTEIPFEKQRALADQVQALIASSPVPVTLHITVTMPREVSAMERAW